MRFVTTITGCTACFLLGTLVPLNTTRAQTQPTKTTYYNLSFMKSLPGHDPASIEEPWKSIHTDLLQSGTIKSWTVLEPMYAGPHNYDYMTLIAFNDLDAYTKIDYPTLFKKHWGESKWQSMAQQTMASRDEIGNEMWVVVAGIGSDPK